MIKKLHYEGASFICSVNDIHILLSCSSLVIGLTVVLVISIYVIYTHKIIEINRMKGFNPKTICQGLIFVKKIKIY